MFTLLTIGLACSTTTKSSIIESQIPVSSSSVEVAPKYVLEGVIPVAGRQGIACDGEFYYVSGSTSLYKYTKDGELVVKEENPFERSINYLDTIAFRKKV